MKTTRKKSPPNYAVPALDKALDILELLSYSEAPLTAAGVARSLSRSPSEIYRILLRLESRGYLMKDAATGEFIVTMRLFALARTHRPNAIVIDAAMKHMRRLAEDSGESCRLCVISHDELLIVTEAPGSAPLRLSVEVGQRFPVVTTVSGRLLLAHMTSEERDQIMIKEHVADKDKASLQERLLEIRRQGFSTAESVYVKGIHDIAVLVGHPQAGFMAALSSSKLSLGQRPSDMRSLLEDLRLCAQRINQDLGLSQIGSLSRV